MIEISRCGRFLDRCQCAGTASNIPRSIVEIAARHKEAVSRATRSVTEHREPRPRPEMSRVTPLAVRVDDQDLARSWAGVTVGWRQA